MGFALTEDQRAVVENRGGGLLVSAAAGSGKTRVLVERLLARVQNEGLNIDKFLVITFTNAAAAELRGRIAKELSQRLAQTPSDKHLRRQSTLVYGAQISTIHALCTSILRECGHEIDIDPDFRLCDEGEAGILRLAALDAVMDARYEAMTDGDDFSSLVDLMSAGRDDSRLVQIALDIFGKIQSHPRPEQWLEEQEKQFRLSGVEDAGDTIWGRLLLDDARRQTAFWSGKLRRIIALCGEEEKLEKGYAPSLVETLDSIEKLGIAAEHGWDEASKVTVEFPRLGSVRDCPRPDLQEQVKRVRTTCKKRMERLQLLLSDPSCDLLGDLKTLHPALRGLFSLVSDYGRAYAAEKQRRNVLDFSDLEHLTVRLLSSETGAPTPLARQLSQRYSEIMVDEYQDTNSVQNAIFTALSQGGQNLFMVGDVKQSVYRFRLADPTIFLAKYRAFPNYKDALEGENRKIVLSQNFRSRPEILAAANFLFRNLMSEDFGELSYGDAEALYPGAVFPETGENYGVELNVLNLANLENDGQGKTDKNLLEARKAARRMTELLGSGFRVTEGSETRPLRPSDMVILLRSPGPVLYLYAQALGEAGIPWEAEGGGAFFETNEIAVALSLLEIIDNPHQDVPLVAALRSPVYGFSADRLAEIRAGQTEGDFYDALRADTGGDSAQFIAQLEGLRFAAADQRSYELLWSIYEETNLLGIFSAMEDGETRRGNLLALYEHARRFEAGGHKGLFGFLTHLHRLRENGTPLTAPQVSAGGGVRILSIHRSKGLEYPVVFLCGLGRDMNLMDLQKPMLFHPDLGVGPKFLDLSRRIEYPTLARNAVSRKLLAETMAEELRLLYVAVTRAKEKLIMSCTVSNGGRTLAAYAEDASCPVEPQALVDAKSVGQWVLTAAMTRPEGELLRQAAEVTLPLYDADFGPSWDIHYLDATTLEQPLTPTESAETAADGDRAVPADLTERFSWQYPFQTAVNIPSKLTATQLKGRNLDEEVAVETRETAPAPKPMQLRRPRFAQSEFGLTSAEQGTALHLVMQFIDFAKTNSLEEVAGEIRRLVDHAFLTPEQGGAVDPVRIFAFFSSDLGKELVSSPTLNREFKFSVLAPACHYYPDLDPSETVLLQGVVDCWYETAEGITVLDFKTDRVTEETAPERAQGYAPQLTAYAKALEEVTGKRVA
ncbi:MAG: helicase-exonuclease AddAB subunit AddA, partial [Oscillospiraceae bacterium]